MLSSRLIELLTSLLLMVLLTDDAAARSAASSSCSLLLAFDAAIRAAAEGTGASVDSIELLLVEPMAVEAVGVAVPGVVDVALPSVEVCCLRLRYSVMESLRFGVIGALAALAPAGDDASAAVVAATSAGLSRGSELAVLVKIFGYAPTAGDPPVGVVPVPGVTPAAPTIDGGAVVLPRVDNDSVPEPSRRDDFTPPPPTSGEVSDPRVEKLVGR